MVERQRVLVVGAGAAGCAAATALKQGAPRLDVVVVGAEDRLPYNRTTVNKGLLIGAVSDEEVGLPGLKDLGVSWRLGQRVRSVDPSARLVELADGSRVTADAIVLATGANPRPLPAAIDPAATDRVLTMRTASDSARLREVLTARPACHVVIAGAGLLGAETAGSLHTVGATVTLVDPAARPLSRQLGATAAGWVHDEHLRAGADLRTGTGVAAVGTAAHAVVVTLDDGETVPADVVVASLGVTPAVEWLRDSGIPVADGVPVDAGMRVLDRPGFYAAGDLAAVPGPDGAPIRTEHWGSALAQGRAAATSVLADLGLGEPREQPPALEPPGYSTYVHGTKLTIVGWTHAAVDEVIVHGKVGDQRFTIALLDPDDRITAAVGVGGARVANRLRGLIARRAEIGEVDRALASAA
jgi:3-phenylpropionate/trans-cinnamate dioxygenase ferredoxin reductase component